MSTLDRTHDPSLQSWVESANDSLTDFPIQNLPFGVFKRRDSSENGRVGVAIGDEILDVSAWASAGMFSGEAAVAAAACANASLNALMSLGTPPLRALRARLSELFRVDTAAEDAHLSLRDALVPAAECSLHLPAEIGDYTDFYASIHHATNVGSMFRPDNPLLPNYKWIPIGYHGRASSIVASGSPVRRPVGQTRDGSEGPPTFGPTRRLDYELEMGIFIGRGNELGSTIELAQAEDHMFGLCLVNDWSARDIQAWEYQPLGPFLAKNFATTISPWVVTIDALAPFRSPAVARPEGDPRPLPYLSYLNDANTGAFDVTLEVMLSSTAMRKAGHEPFRVSTGGFAGMYWTFAQMLTHHASNGCNMQPADLLASGTVSGTAKDSRGCLLERTWRGAEPLELPSGEKRAFLEDGDEVIMRGYCERAGHRRIGFGDVRGRISPAV